MARLPDADSFPSPVTVNVPALAVSPSGLVTVTVPVVAPMGTRKVRLLCASTVTLVATVPLTSTVTVPKKPVPSLLTVTTVRVNPLETSIDKVPKDKKFGAGMVAPISDFQG
jgi:hypothetical protein